MKTIVELQDSIKGITASLQNISVELAEYGKAADNAPAVDFAKVDAIGKNSFFPHHPLANCPQKSHYLSLLLTIALKNRGDLSAWQFLSRIAFGAGYTDGMESLVADAMTLNEARLVQATDTVNQYNLKHNFVVDSLVLYTVMQEKNPTLLEYMASIYEILGVDDALMDECLTMAKIIAENDKEAYFDHVNRWKYLKQWDFLGYIVKCDSRIVNEIDGIESYAEEQIIVLDAKIVGQQILVDLDLGESKDIMFLNCDFEKMSCIVAEKKQIVFESCRFKENYTLFEVSDSQDYHKNIVYPSCLKAVVDYSDYMQYNIQAWINIKKSSFRNCDIKGYNSAIPLLKMENGKMIGCVFSDCRMLNPRLYGWSSSRWETVNTGGYLLHFANTVLKDVSFNKCQNETQYESNHATGCLILLENSNLSYGKFKKCLNWVGGNYGRYSHNYSFLLFLKGESTVKDCLFEKISCISKNDSDHYVEPYAIALYKMDVDKIEAYSKNNTFDECYCPYYTGDYYSNGNEVVGVTDREIE